MWSRPAVVQKGHRKAAQREALAGAEPSSALCHTARYMTKVESLQTALQALPNLRAAVRMRPTLHMALQTRDSDGGPGTWMKPFPLSGHLHGQLGGASDASPLLRLQVRRHQRRHLAGETEGAVVLVFYV